MISLTIKDTKSFMSHLLVKDTFDELLLSEAVITTANTFSIDGSINRTFFNDDELSMLKSSKYSLWKNIKPFCFSLIKGNKVPTGMKIIMLLQNDAIERLLDEASLNYSGLLPACDINGLFLNISYGDGTATIVTGTSFKTFTLDKTTEHCFDAYIRSFLESNGIGYEEA